MEYPKTTPYGVPPFVPPAPEKGPKKPSRFVRLLKAVFVHNLGYKLLAIGSSIVLWVLAVGLSV